MKSKKQTATESFSTRPGFWGRMRTYFLAGILVLAPITITFYLAYSFISFVDQGVSNLFPAHYKIELPGLGLVLALVGITLVGALATNFLGRMFISVYERILNRTPIIRSIYGGVKQIFETLFKNQSTAFRQVVLVEFPRKGIWSLAFLTGTTQGELQEKTKEKTVNVFMPTTPNPTTGFLMFVPESQIVPLDMKVDEAFKALLSSGIITPTSKAMKTIEANQKQQKPKPKKAKSKRK